MASVGQETDQGHRKKALTGRTCVSTDTYVTSPSSDNANGHVVLYFPDVFGFFTNGLLVCDEFAAAGYLTIGIDYFQGDPVFMHRDGPKQPSEGFDFEAWLAKNNKFAVEHVDDWIKAVKQKYGKPETKYACVGYCFGVPSDFKVAIIDPETSLTFCFVYFAAPYVMNSITKGTSGSPPACDVGAFAHPAFLKEHHFENIERPLFLSCAETDFTFETDARNKAITILREAKKPYSLQLFSGVEHGFALRCDLSKPYERWCKEQSAKGIADYFDLQLDVFDKKSQEESKL